MRPETDGKKKKYMDIKTKGSPSSCSAQPEPQTAIGFHLLSLAGHALDDHQDLADFKNA